VPSLVRAIKASNIRVLVLNGSAVVREINSLLGAEKLNAREMPAWSLQGGRVPGLAYFGRVTALKNVSLDRELLVLGYNHNIQSSYGVTGAVVSGIAAWIADSSAGVIA
jgi:hypothetical protein